MATSPLSPPDIEQRVRARLGERVLEFTDAHDQAAFRVVGGDYHEAAGFLKNDPDLMFDFLELVCGVDREADGIDVVAQMYSTSHGHSVRVMTRCDGAEPHCATISDLFPGANWHERETAEMFGVVFDGHPYPVKLLLDPGFEGHPLRKDFTLMSREAKPWPGATEIADDA